MSRLLRPLRTGAYRLIVACSPRRSRPRRFDAYAALLHRASLASIEWRAY